MLACTTSLHRHPPAARACENCGGACGPDDVIVTTTRRRWVCGPCYARYRDAWMRKPEKDARIAAVAKAVAR